MKQSHAYGTGYSPEILKESAKDALLCVEPILEEFLRGHKFPDSTDEALPESFDPEFLIRLDQVPAELKRIAENADSMSPQERREAFHRVADIRNTIVYKLK